MLIAYKEMFAKLMANENIRIEYGNFPTAFFNVETRVLGLPSWNDADTYDLLIGHEVSHALYTPMNEWKKVVGSQSELTHDMVNVIEDVRIERLIQRRYPGLAKDFRRGYRSMLDRRIFDLKGKLKATITEHSFLDRINIAAKVGFLVDVDFTKEEAELFDACNKTETFQDVIDLCHRIFEFVKDQKQKATTTVDGDVKNEEDGGNPIDKLFDFDDLEDNDEDDLDEHKIGSPTATSEVDEDDLDDDIPESEALTAQEQENLSPRHGDFEAPEESALDGFGGGRAVVIDEDGSKQKALDENGRTIKEELESKTQKETEENIRKKLMDDPNSRWTSSVPTAKPLTKKMIDACVQPAKERDNTPYEGHVAEYTKFLGKNKSIINSMVREFEIRKKAAAYRKSKTVKKGALDMKKLSEYKFNDDIFLRATKIPNGKSHGMAMLIDFSGSMDRVLKKVIEQTIMLAIFCRKTSIPFKVYSFTSGSRLSTRAEVNALEQPGYVSLAGTFVDEWLTSSMTKEEFNRAATNLLCRSHRMGGTPLDEALLVIQPLVKAIKQQNNLDRMNFIVLTDGCGSSPAIRNREYGTQRAVTIQADRNHILKMPKGYADNERGMGSQESTTTILDWYRSSGAADTITHFFMVDRWTLGSVGMTSRTKKPKIMFNTGGYDLKLLIPSTSKSMSGKTEELEFEPDAKKGAITRAFKNHVGSKKDSRVIVKTFAEVIS